MKTSCIANFELYCSKWEHISQSLVEHPKWNFKKAKWQDRFAKMVLFAANKYIPRGVLKSANQLLYDEYLVNGRLGVADILLHNLDEARKGKLIEKLDESIR